MSNLFLSALAKTAELTLSLLVLVPTAKAAEGGIKLAENALQSQIQQQPDLNLITFGRGGVNYDVAPATLGEVELSSFRVAPGHNSRPEVSSPEFSISEPARLISASSDPWGLLAQAPARDRGSQTDIPGDTPVNEGLGNNEGVRENEESRILIEDIQVAGNTVFDASTLDAIVAPFEGKALTTDDIVAVSDAITQLYLDHGYFTSRAFLKEQPLVGGVLTINVLERAAKLEIKWLEGNNWLQESYIRDRIQAISPLNTLAIEDELKLLRRSPLLASLEARLQRNPEAEADTLMIEVREVRNFNGSFSIDNESPPSIGGERFVLRLGSRNLSRRADSLDATYRTTVTGGLQSFELAYEVPMNAKEGTLAFQGNWDFTKVTQAPYDVLGIEGDRQRYDLSYRQPLVRTSVQELALFAGFTYTEGQTFIFGDIPVPFGIGPNAEGLSRTSVIRLGQEYIRRDKQGAWVARSTQNFGTGWFGATDNPAPIPDGQFFSWLSQGQRIQVINPNHLLVMQAELQLTPHSLLPSEQFVIGGRQSVRGYRQNALIGDNGVRLSIEDRITVRRDREGEASLLIMPFLEMGAVLNSSGNPNSIASNQTVLAGTGLGILWKPIESLEVRADYGLALVDWDQKGENIQDHGFYFRTSYNF